MGLNPDHLKMRLPESIHSRVIEDVNGLDMHILEAGHGVPGRPLLLLLHGFPELAFSWRHVMPVLADAGYHVVAPDQRGYGRTKGWTASFDEHPRSFGLFNLVTDMLVLLQRLQTGRVAAVIGHDFGSFVAACCALIRPDRFLRVALMSAPFAGVPDLKSVSKPHIHAGLAALDPPRKHYQWYYSTALAGPDMLNAPQGLRAFLRAYFHVKSADWPENRPEPLDGWNADALALLPRYYIMDLNAGMAETVAPHMPGPKAVAACRWLDDDDLAVYVQEFARTGFQGGLNWYRCGTSDWQNAEMSLFSGRRIDVPCCFIAGAADWGIYQSPGALEAMAERRSCSECRLVELVPGAGHWVQQERPEAVAGHIIRFLNE